MLMSVVQIHLSPPNHIETRKSSNFRGFSFFPCDSLWMNTMNRCLNLPAPARPLAKHSLVRLSRAAHSPLAHLSRSLSPAFVAFLVPKRAVAGVLYGQNAI
jgi:hypothetical protein